MPRILHRLAAICLGLALASAASAAPPLRLEAGVARVPLAGHLEQLEDPSRALTIEDVARSDAPFVSSGAAEPNLGLSASAWWIRFQVAPSDAPGPWLLELAWPMTDFVDLYVPRAGGGFDVQRGGDSLVPPPDPPQRNPTFALPAAGGTFFLRITSENSQALPLAVWSRDALETHERREVLMLGLLHGVLALVVGAGLIFAWMLRDPTYLFYAGLTGGFAVWDAINDGLLSTYVVPGWWWSNRGLHISMVFAVFAQVAFVRRFLNLADHSPGLDRFGFFTLCLFPILALWPFVGPVQLFVRTAVVLAVASVVWTIWAGVASLLRGERSARFFLAAWGLFLLAALPYAARGIGWAPTSTLSEHGIQFGIVMTSLTLWLGLSDRLRATTRDLQELNVSLEDRIRQRTAELEETSEALARANDAKRDFLAAASHDLRQPLHALNLLLGAMDAKIGQSDGRALFDQAQQSAQGMSDMLDALLDLSKLDAGVIETSVSDFALAPMLRQLGDELQGPAGRKGLALRIDAGNASVRSDPLLLRRIVQNLMTNAIRYTERGHVEVRCEDDGDGVWIRVADTGRGIPEAKRRHIFDEYTRLESEDGGGKEGLGLGLSIVQRLARLLGHPLELSSQEGEGSVFSVRVERGEARLALPVAEPAALGFGGALVVVIDDDPTILGGMEQLLSSWDCRVVSATSLADANDQLPSDGDLPAAVLADYHLSDAETGVAAIGALRDRLGAELPAMLLSADSSPAAKEDARKRGLLLLRKPVAPPRLRVALNHLLGAGSA